MMMLGNENTNAQRNKKNDHVVESAKMVLERLIGSRVKDFELIHLQQSNSNDYFEFSAAKGIVTIKGTTTIAITRGFYEFLRSQGYGMVTWSGKRLQLPNHFPDLPVTSGKTAFTFREYFNVCTFGYTTVWWDWKRWEKELDWMALHGINMPLAMVGQEIIWTRLWESFGVKRNELNDFFTGPAFLPWQRMGNVNKHGGPLSNEWMENQKVLQHKILTRMRELGMQPIAPAFSGFVPPSFAQKFPGQKIIKNSNWGNFPDGFQTYVLPPDAPLFIEIGKKFITEYEKEYGNFDYYLADTFNELDVPVSQENRYNELAAYGKAVFNSISEGNPKANWVMQGWMFGNDQRFWDTASVSALLRDVPNNRVVIIDLADEMFEGWKKFDGFYGKKWISSVIHNFGGNNPLYGDIKFFAHCWADVLGNSNRGNVIGIGLSPEGIENNEVIYELLTDGVWTPEPIDLTQWLKFYMASRYGSSSLAITLAWQKLIEHVYTFSSLNFKHAFQTRPSANPNTSVKDTTSLREIVDVFIASYNECKTSNLFLNDLLEVTAHYAGTKIDEKLKLALAAHEVGEFAMRDTLANEALSMMNQFDEMLSTRKDLRLDTWISSARSLGKSKQEKSLLEQNARTQVTIWGGPDLYDYASKLWSGLISDFYRKRWGIYFKGLKENANTDSLNQTIKSWEVAWTLQRNYSEPIQSKTPYASAVNLLSAIDHSLNVAPTPNINVEKHVIVKNDSLLVTLSSQNSSTEIRYTLNGDEPSKKSILYVKPFYIFGSTVIKAKSFLDKNNPGITATKEISQVDASNGILCSYYEQPIPSLNDPGLKSFTPVKTKKVYAFDISEVAPRSDDFIEIFETQLEISTAGEYTFFTESDDGSRLLLDDSLVVNNDGYHARKEVSGNIALQKGKHSLRVEFFEARGAEYLKVSYDGPDFNKKAIEAGRLFLPITVRR